MGGRNSKKPLANRPAAVVQTSARGRRRHFTTARATRSGGWMNILGACSGVPSSRLAGPCPSPLARSATSKNSVRVVTGCTDETAIPLPSSSAVDVILASNPLLVYRKRHNSADGVEKLQAAGVELEEVSCLGQCDRAPVSIDAEMELEH